MRKLRNNKAPGEDGIPAEIFKSCVDTLAPWFHEVIERAWRDEVVPDDWGLGSLVPILKKGDKTRCENYRGISLIDVAAMIFVIVLLRRFQAVRDSRTRPNQAGFRAGRGCADQIFTLRRILEFRHSYQQPTAVCFVDFAAAFDSVHHESLWRIMALDGVPEKIIAMIKAYYRSTTARVPVRNNLSQPFGIRSGVRQGCILSPILFNYAIDSNKNMIISQSHQRSQPFGASQPHSHSPVRKIPMSGFQAMLRTRCCQAISKSRWVFRVDVCEEDVADENVDPGVVTSFPADILVSKVRRPLTEAYKYKVAMSHLQPIVEKLKSCGSQRFELLREVDAFADRIMNAPSGSLQESLVDSPSQPNGDEMEVDTSDEVVRCHIREEGSVCVAQWGSDQDPSEKMDFLSEEVIWLKTNFKDMKAMLADSRRTLETVSFVSKEKPPVIQLPLRTADDYGDFVSKIGLDREIAEETEPAVDNNYRQQNTGF
ncbi:hypothetical protein SprV_0301351300 [Sparganum proliferum]